jgi:hypothetical protein
MKQPLDAAIAFRKQMNDFLTTVQHNAQGVARQDIDSLMLTVRHIETRLLNSLSLIASQLASIEHRLEKLEQNPARNGEATPEQSAPQTETRIPEGASS